MTVIVVAVEDRVALGEVEDFNLAERWVLLSRVRIPDPAQADYNGECTAYEVAAGAPAGKNPSRIAAWRWTDPLQGHRCREPLHVLVCGVQDVLELTGTAQAMLAHPPFVRTP